jgi:hypothetical protein
MPKTNAGDEKLIIALLRMASNHKITDTQARIRGTLLARQVKSTSAHA